MPKCKACEGTIIFRRTLEGRLMPCQPTPIKVLTLEGQVIQAYDPHWSHCTKPEAFRRKKKK